MTISRGRVRRSALILAAGLAAAMPGALLAMAGLEALSQLEKGRWQVRDLDAGVSEELCLRDPMILLEIEHQGAPCDAEVIESGPAGGTVRYTCRGRGFGHSTIRVQTPRAARIDTQGIKDSRPFSYRVDARKIGDC